MQRCCGKMADYFVHSWCFFLVAIPDEITNCAWRMLCCGCCNHSDNSAALGASASNAGDNSGGSELPKRLQRRWRKYKNEYEHANVPPEGFFTRSQRIRQRKSAHERPETGVLAFSSEGSKTSTEHSLTTFSTASMYPQPLSGQEVDSSRGVGTIGFRAQSAPSPSKSHHSTINSTSSVNNDVSLPGDGVMVTVSPENGSSGLSSKLRKRGLRVKSRKSADGGDVELQEVQHTLKKVESAPNNAATSGSVRNRRRGSIFQRKDTFAVQAGDALEEAAQVVRERGDSSVANETREMRNSELAQVAQQEGFLRTHNRQDRKRVLRRLLNLGKARAQYCRFVKEKYWHVFEEGLLDKLAFRDLAEAEDQMLDATDGYFLTLNHSISDIVDHMSDEVAAHAWKIFPWESFVVNGELKSFSKWLRPLTNIPKTVIYMSSIRCLSWLLRRHLYFFVNRARDIAANFVHAHEEVIRHIEHNGLFPPDISQQIICEAEFQIMEAKDVLHNIDEVFPEIAAHLQTITATRYLLRQEQANIHAYLHSGEISGTEHEVLMDSVLKSLQKLKSHPRPQSLTPDFQRLLFDQDRHKETFSRVLDNLPSLEQKFRLLRAIADGAQMVYLRAGDLVYEQGAKKDHAGQASASKMGIYYIARGATTSVWVPGNIVLSRRARNERYFKELSRIRKAMLQTLVSRRQSTAVDTDRASLGHDGAGGERKTGGDNGTAGGKGSERTNHLLTRSSIMDMMSAKKTQQLAEMLEALLHEDDDEYGDDVKVLNRSTESTSDQGSMSDQALQHLCKELPGFKDLMDWHNARRSSADGVPQEELGVSSESIDAVVGLDSKEKDGDGGGPESGEKSADKTVGGTKLMKKRGAFVSHRDATSEHVSAEEEYVRKMLAPSKSMTEDMFTHGADVDGSGAIRYVF